MMRERQGDDHSAVLALVQGLVDELQPGRAMPVTMDQRLDRDLGLDSLALVELLVRVEHAFGIVLPDSTLSEAATPADLLAAMRVARRTTTAPTVAAGSTAPTPLPPTPENLDTLTDVLDWHAHAHPDRVHLVLTDSAAGEQELSYAQLQRAALDLAIGLHARGIAPGERIAIMLPTGRDYFVSFVAVLLAGAIPVPLYPPFLRTQLEEHLRRQARILDDAGAVMLITVAEARPLARLVRPRVPSLRHIVTTADLRGADGQLPSTASNAAAADAALFQYTSGSTGAPKGVVLSHANLLANVRAMGTAAQAQATDVFVSWLPLYHDMGLIGAWMASLYHGFPLIVMPPTAFLTRPARWLWAIHDHRGTMSAAPNFAYQMCVDRIDDAELAGLDLGSWRLAFNGAEPISPATLDQFCDRFARYGFRREAMAPVYGLAEGAVGLTFPPVGRGPLIDAIARGPFEEHGIALPADGNGDADGEPLRIVACGQVLPGHELRVVGTAGEVAGDRREGRIEFRGPSATSGYHGRPDATARLRRDGWLDTGDLGYLADGELYVTGRIKDLIIRAGRNLHPSEMEEVIGEIPGVRKGCVAVFAARDRRAGTEALVVVAETREADRGRRDQLRRRIIEVTVDLVGTPPDDVVLARPRAVLKTSSGKIRHAQCREWYEQGRLERTPPPPWWQLVRLAATTTVPRLRAVGRALPAGLYGAYVLGIGVLVLLATRALTAVLPRRRGRRAVARAAARLLLAATGHAVELDGAEQLPPGPHVIVANHSSIIDPVVLLLALTRPDVRFVAAEDARVLFVSHAFLRRVGTEFIERHDRRRAAEDTDRLLRLVRSGQSLVFFSEGHLEAAPALEPFHLGAFIVATSAQVPVVPVAIVGTRAILAPGRALPRRGAVCVRIGEPLRAVGSGWSATVRLRDSAHEAVAALAR